MNEKVIIIGAGGHAKVVADIVRKSGDVVLGFLDDDESKRGVDFFGSKILGKACEYEKYADEACFFIAIGNNAVRARIAESMTCRFYTAVHPTAVIGEGAEIGEGAFIGALAVINPDAKVGKHSIINTSAVVEHDCAVGAYAHLSPNAAMCGASNVGEGSWIGAGATVTNGKRICSETVIGAGAVVAKDIDLRGTYVGVPAKKLEK